MICRHARTNPLESAVPFIIVEGRFRIPSHRPAQSCECLILKRYSVLGSEQADKYHYFFNFVLRDVQQSVP